MLWAGLLVLGLGAAVLMLTHESGRVGGLTSDQFADLTRIVALSLLIGAGVLATFRGRWRTAALSILGWAAIALLLVGLYAYRQELSSVGMRVYGALVPGAAVTLVNGEDEAVVRIAREAGGQFAVTASVNGERLPMMVDTGASAVTLTEDAARMAGVAVENLRFTVPVQTANGMAYVAPITLREIAIGPIAESEVTAFVAPAGALQISLLGMTFLERLTSYEVRGDALFFRQSR